MPAEYDALVEAVRGFRDAFNEQYDGEEPRCEHFRKMFQALDAIDQLNTGFFTDA